jgi:hypothetical protein
MDGNLRMSSFQPEELEVPEESRTPRLRTSPYTLAVDNGSSESRRNLPEPF